MLQTTGFVNEENINEAGTWSLGLLQMDFFYRKKRWYAGQYVRKISAKETIKDRAVTFFTTILNKVSPMLSSVLVRHVNKVFENIIVKLPTKDGKLDFEFMENVVSLLEMEQITRVDKYLTNANLQEYDLTKVEKDAIKMYDKMEWKQFKMNDLFKRLSTKKLPYKAKELPREPVGKHVLPCLTSSFMNQGLNYYAPKVDATILRNVISLPSNSDVYRAYFQSQDFTVLSDAYTIEWIYNDRKITNNQYLFAVSCINEVTDLPIYSYKNKLGGWNVVKEKFISLPVKEGEPDYDLMELLVSALKKKAIENTVDWVKKMKKFYKL